MISSSHASTAKNTEIKSNGLYTLHNTTYKASQNASQILSSFTETLWIVPSNIHNFIYNLYLITIDDSPTFVVPNTVFGMAAASTCSLLLLPSGTQKAPLSSLPWLEYLFTLGKTLSFNWTNLLLFDLANQRNAGAEDKLNKPWRPIPSGRISGAQMRHWLLAALPLILAFNYWGLDTGLESCMLAVLTWMYNDLGAGDENWVIRNGVIAAAFGVYNLGSMRVAASTAARLSLAPAARSAPAPLQQNHLIDYMMRGSAVGGDSPTTSAHISTLGYAWAAAISGVILTTMHIQDLKDVVGDRARGRKTAPITLGRYLTSLTIAVPVLLWSVICAWLWVSSVPMAAATLALGAIVAIRCLIFEDKKKDRRTWQLWCLWTAVLYLLPPFSS